jgi:hypothetical protein
MLAHGAVERLERLLEAALSVTAVPVSLHLVADVLRCKGAR